MPEGSGDLAEVKVTQTFIQFYQSHVAAHSYLVMNSSGDSESDTKYHFSLIYRLKTKII